MQGKVVLGLCARERFSFAEGQSWVLHFSEASELTLASAPNTAERRGGDRVQLCGTEVLSHGDVLQLAL